MNLEEEIDEMAEKIQEKVEKSQENQELKNLLKTIRNLGKEGLKKKIPELSLEQRRELKTILKKAINEDLTREAWYDENELPQKTQEPVTETHANHPHGVDKESEDLVMDEMQHHYHQGGDYRARPEGWTGQEIEDYGEEGQPKAQTEKSNPVSTATQQELDGSTKDDKKLRNENKKLAQDPPTNRQDFDDQKLEEYSEDANMSKEYKKVLDKVKKALSEEDMELLQNIGGSAEHVKHHMMLHRLLEDEESEYGKGYDSNKEPGEMEKANFTSVSRKLKDDKESNENLEKERGVPEGVDPQKHERCVQDLKDQGHDKESAIRICNDSLRGKIQRSNTKKSMEKAKGGKGEGARGGKVIGHTRSGKPIYASKKPKEYENFNSEDHKDAAAVHHLANQHHNSQEDEASLENRDQASSKRKESMRHHGDMADNHANESRDADFDHEEHADDVKEGNQKVKVYQDQIEEHHNSKTQKSENQEEEKMDVIQKAEKTGYTMKDMMKRMKDRGMDKEKVMAVLEKKGYDVEKAKQEWDNSEEVEEAGRATDPNYKPKKAEKSIEWNDPTKEFLGASYKNGINFHYDANNTLLQQELYQKSFETSDMMYRNHLLDEEKEKMDKSQEESNEENSEDSNSVNDLIAKGYDMNESRLKLAKANKKAPTPGSFNKKTFDEEEVAKAMGLDEESINKILKE